MDLSSGGVLTGVVRFVDAIISTFALSFALDWGSRLFLFFQSIGGRARSVDASTQIQVRNVTCGFIDGEDWSGSWALKNDTIITGPPTLQTLSGCSLRSQYSPWYIRPLPTWAPAFLCIAFSIFISLHHMQHWRSRQFPVMIFISCMAFIVNRIVQRYLFQESEGASLIGGFAIGLMGHLWSRLFRGTAFTVMLTGVQLLFPVSLHRARNIMSLICLYQASLAAGGGLIPASQADLQADIQAGISPVFMVGYRMLSVTLGMATGFHLSALVVYAFGKRKNSVLLSF